MKLVDEIGAIVPEADPSSLREVFRTLGAVVVIRHETGRVGNRLNLPISAELRLRGALGELREDGRGNETRIELFVQGAAQLDPLALRMLLAA